MALLLRSSLVQFPLHLLLNGGSFVVLLLIEDAPGAGHFCVLGAELVRLAIEKVFLSLGGEGHSLGKGFRMGGAFGFVLVFYETPGGGYFCQSGLALVADFLQEEELALGGCLEFGVKEFFGGCGGFLSVFEP